MIVQVLVLASSLVWAVPPSATTQASLKTYAVLETNFGKMIAELYADQAPITVENFTRLASQGFYLHLPSHRMIPGFMVQLGRHTNPDLQAAVKPIQGEFSTTLKHYEGVLSMARSQDADSATSQFFICFANRKGASQFNLDGKYAIFGRLIEGYDVLRMIEMVRVGANAEMRGEESRPLEDIFLQNVTIIRSSTPPRWTAGHNMDALLDVGNTIVAACRDPDTEMHLVDTWHEYLLSARDMIGLTHFKPGLEYHEKYLASIPAPSVLVSALTMNMTASGQVQVVPVGGEEGQIPPSAGELMFITKAGNIPLSIYRLILPSEGEYRQLSFIWIGQRWRWLGPLETWLPNRPEELLAFQRAAMGAQAGGVEGVTPKVADSMPPEARSSLAVFDFAVDPSIVPEMGMKMAELCRRAIDETQQYRVLDQPGMLDVLGTEGMAAAADCPDLQCRLSYAGQLKADKMVYGKITDVGVTYVLNVMLMDVKTTHLDGQATIKAVDDPENLAEVIPVEVKKMVLSAAAAGG